MAIRKQCKSKGQCKHGNHRCDHPWWLDVMHNGVRYRMRVDDFATARGATELIKTKEAAKPWEEKFVAEIRAGHDPRQGPAQVPETLAERSVSDYIDAYLKYVGTLVLRSRRSKESCCRGIKRAIGNHLARDLQKVGPAEDLRRFYADRAVATVNRYLAELRCIVHWGLSRGDFEKSPFQKFGVRICTKDEVQRDRRVYDEEEMRLLEACARLDERKEGASRLSWELVRIIRSRAAAGESQKAIAESYGLSSGMLSLVVNGRIWRENAPSTNYGREMRDRIIGALETCCRKGELLLIQNKHIDWQNGWIKIPKEHAKGKKERIIPFNGNARLTEILERRKFLGDEAYVFGEWTTGARVKDFRRAWESVVLIANGMKPAYRGRHQKLSQQCCEKLAEASLHFHDLRHEGLSRYGEGGMLLRELQTLAGHADPKTTTRYEHVDSIRLTQAMRRARETREERLKESVAKVG